MNWHATAGLLAASCMLGAMLSIAGAADEPYRSGRWITAAVVLVLIGSLLFGYVAS